MGNAGLQENCHMGLPVCIQLVVPKPAGEIHLKDSISWVLAYVKTISEQAVDDYWRGLADFLAQKAWDY